MTVMEWQNKIFFSRKYFIIFFDWLISVNQWSDVLFVENKTEKRKKKLKCPQLFNIDNNWKRTLLFQCLCDTKCCIYFGPIIIENVIPFCFRFVCFTKMMIDWLILIATCEGNFGCAFFFWNFKYYFFLIITIIEMPMS